MDEGIDLMRTLWRGGREFTGRHYTYTTERDDLHEALGAPRAEIPIWVVGLWPRPRSMRRVLRCDGILPAYDGPDWGPDRLREVRDWLADRADHPIDIVSEGETTTDAAEATDTVQPWAEAGATWWMETRWDMPHHSPERMRQVRERIAAGPPRAG